MSSLQLRTQTSTSTKRHLSETPSRTEELASNVFNTESNKGNPTSKKIRADTNSELEKSILKSIQESPKEQQIQEDQKSQNQNHTAAKCRSQKNRNFKEFKKECSSFVYLDETWIFSKGGIKRIWQDESTKSIKHTDTEGKRYIIVHAGGKHGFIEGADIVFSSKSADYHGNMNTEMFLKWLKEKLLPSLHEPSVIVLDNASYHSEILNKQPTNSWTVDKIKEWLTNKNITFPQYCFKPQLLTLAKSHAQPNIYMVDEIIHT
uniref:Uncharacterized protein LOC114339331 n=1 Tax=Diabrotica virgifera virgifera TaxID=50390 RepID=A0A6P7G9G8_DIAVI